MTTRHPISFITYKNFYEYTVHCSLTPTNTHITHSHLQTGGIETAVLEGGHIFRAEGYHPCNEGSARENHSKGYQEGYRREF
jgi:hypothetical protein